jgi:hypothetical protein
MARKDFHFDFDEDADPVEELHRLRVATAKHFKTDEALLEYYNSVPPIEEIRARLKAEIAAQKVAGTDSPRKTKTAKKPAARKKTAKRLVHA